MTSVTLRDFHPISTWEHNADRTQDVNLTSGRNFQAIQEEKVSAGQVLRLCAGTAVGQLVLSVQAIVARVFRLITFTNFRETLPDKDNHLSARLLHTGNDLGRLVALPLTIIGTCFASLYMLARPQDGRNLYASFERLAYGDLAERNPEQRWMLSPQWQPVKEDDPIPAESTVTTEPAPEEAVTPPRSESPHVHFADDETTTTKREAEAEPPTVAVTVSEDRKPPELPPSLPSASDRAPKLPPTPPPEEEPVIAVSSDEEDSSSSSSSSESDDDRPKIKPEWLSVRFAPEKDAPESRTKQIKRRHSFDATAESTKEKRDRLRPTVSAAPIGRPRANSITAPETEAKRSNFLRSFSTRISRVFHPDEDTAIAKYRERDLDTLRSHSTHKLKKIRRKYRVYERRLEGQLGSDANAAKYLANIRTTLSRIARLLGERKKK